MSVALDVGAEKVARDKYDIDWLLSDYEPPDEDEMAWERYNEPKGREVW